MYVAVVSAGEGMDQQINTGRLNRRWLYVPATSLTCTSTGSPDVIVRPVGRPPRPRTNARMADNWPRSSMRKAPSFGIRRTSSTKLRTMSHAATPFGPSKALVRAVTFSR